MCALFVRTLILYLFHYFVLFVACEISQPVYQANRSCARARTQGTLAIWRKRDPMIFVCFYSVSATITRCLDENRLFRVRTSLIRAKPIEQCKRYVMHTCIYFNQYHHLCVYVCLSSAAMWGEVTKRETHISSRFFWDRVRRRVSSIFVLSVRTMRTKVKDLCVRACTPAYWCGLVWWFLELVHFDLWHL